MIWEKVINRGVVLKKIILILTVIISLAFNVIVTKAQGNESQRFESIKYVTVDDVLVSMIAPKINQIIESQYGKKMMWNIRKVESVSLKNDYKNNHPEVSWYEIELYLSVGEQPNYHEGLLKIKIDTPEISRSYSQNLEGDFLKNIEVKLLRYTKIK